MHQHHSTAGTPSATPTPCHSWHAPCHSSTCTAHACTYHARMCRQRFLGVPGAAVLDTASPDASHSQYSEMCLTCIAQQGYSFKTACRSGIVVVNAATGQHACRRRCSAFPKALSTQASAHSTNATEKKDKRDSCVKGSTVDACCSFASKSPSVRLSAAHVLSTRCYHTHPLSEKRYIL